MSQSALKILVVDDQLLIRKFVAKILSRAGYDVRCAADAPEAIRAAEAEAFDVVISDWKMPGMNGVELVTFLCSRGLTQRAILMSGYPTEELEQSLPVSWPVLAKPFTPKRLLSVVSDGKRERLENL